MKVQHHMHFPASTQPTVEPLHAVEGKDKN